MPVIKTGVPHTYKGETMIEKTALPFKLAITDEMLTPFSGLALFGEFLRTIGLEREVGGIFPAPGSARGF